MNLNDELLNASSFDNTTLIAEEVKPNNNNEKITDRWTGKVIANNDTKRLGRVKIMIYGYYDELPTNTIPWAIPDIKFLGSCQGNFVVPEVDTVVRGYFDKGDIQRPIFDSVAFTQEQLDKSSYIKKTDFDYPNTIVFFETSQGDIMTLNKVTGAMLFKHRNGCMVQFDNSGALNIQTGDGAVNLDGTQGGGNCTINVKGATQINSSGVIDIISDGDVNVNSVAGSINLGDNKIAPNLVCNLPNCLVTGAPHQVGNIKVKV